MDIAWVVCLGILPAFVACGEVERCQVCDSRPSAPPGQALSERLDANELASAVNELRANILGLENALEKGFIRESSSAPSGDTLSRDGSAPPEAITEIMSRLDRIERALDQRNESRSMEYVPTSFPKNLVAINDLCNELDLGSLSLVSREQYESAYKEVRSKARRRIFGASCEDVFAWLGLPDAVSGNKWIYRIEKTQTLSVIFFDGYAVDLEIR